MTDSERPGSERPLAPEEWPPDAVIDAGRQLRAMGRAAEALAACRDALVERGVDACDEFDRCSGGDGHGGSSILGWSVANWS
jgi:hypothetical protein